MTTPDRHPEPEPGRQALELLFFLGASGLGIFSLGNAIGGLFEPGGSANPVWLLVTAIAVWFLVAQMGRVHDAWPRHKDLVKARPHPGTSPLGAEEKGR